MSSAAHSELLWRKIHFADAVLGSASGQFWRSDYLRQLYPRFLVQLYHVVLGGLDLMRFAADRSESMASDPVAAVGARYLRQHIGEEDEHAEWLLDDLATLGLDRNTVTSARPMPAVVSLIGEQFFWISSFHPVSVFGYLLVLEGQPPLTAELDAIRLRTGLPASAFHCLLRHAEDDPAHLEDLNRTLDSMPLNEAQARRLSLSAYATIEGVSSLLHALLAAEGHTPWVGHG